jgi:hypothetical protein
VWYVFSNMLLKKLASICRTDLLRPFYQIVNPKGEMKGSAISGPVGKEAAELWPVSTLCQDFTI